MNRFSIKDIENLTGIKAHTLRIWEQRHGILIPKRTDTNIRYYDGNDLKKALRVALLNQHGYKISRIQKMDDEDIDDAINEIEDPAFHLDNIINKLLEHTIDMDMDKFEKQLNKFINKNGIIEAVEGLIFHFLQKLGMMWMTSKIFPAQEHLVTNVIQRKILLAIEKLNNPTSDGDKQYLLFLPEGEHHDIGLLYMHYYLLSNGHKVLYLGADSPLEQVKLVREAMQPDHIYTHLTSVTNDFDLNGYILKLSEMQPDNDIYISGTMIQRSKILDLPENVVFVQSLDQAKGIATIS